MGTHENQTYEVHVHTNGRWHVHARFPFHQRPLAIREAQQLDEEQTGQPVRIVLEEYNPETGRHNEIVIYRNRVEPAVKPKVRARRGNSWADIAVSADGRVGYVNDKAQDTFEDPFSEYERPKAHVGVGMFLAIISTIIVIGLGAGGAAAAMLALLMEGFDVTMADKLRKAMLVGMFIVVFLIACLSSISYYTQRFDLNPFKKKHKTPAPQPVTKISQEMQKAAAEIDKMPVLVVEKANPEEKEKEETFSIFDNIGNLEITQPDDTIAFSEKAEEQKMLMVNFLGTCLGALKGPNAKAENLNRFGLNLFMTGAVSRLARDNKLTDDEFDVILRRILEMLGQNPIRLNGLPLSLKKHLDDPRHQALFDSSGDIVQRFKNGDRSAPLQIRETIESWVNWKNEAELAINPNLLIIMFTDMVGSTDLASKHGDYAAQEVLKAHDLIVRTALTNFDGREIKHLGDGIMASFKDHDKAIQAAIEIQKRVDGNNSSAPEFPLHVRIGLNAGEPIKKDNDLFGNAVQLAARICDNAASDCINLSQDLKNLFGEKPAYTFAPLGAQMLKGFEEAQNLYILDWKAPLITYPAETPVPAPIPVEGTPENNKVELVATEGIAPDMAAQKPVKQIREDPNFARGMVLTPKKTPSAQPDPDKKTNLSPPPAQTAALKDKSADHDQPPPDGFLVKPDPDGIDTTEHIVGLGQLGEVQTQCVIEEHPLTIFLNNREIVTLMTIRDYPEMLSVGYLVNQQMLKDCDIITDIEYDAEIDVCVVRTDQTTAYEHRLKRKVLTSGCGMGTLFGDIMDTLSVPDQINAQTLAASAIIRALKVIKDTPSLYQKAGSIHACVVCHADQPLIYMEDVGRHNALDKIAGYIHLHKPDIPAPYLYTTGRLTSEMVIKSLSMNIPVVISRSGATHWAIKLTKQYGQTLITRARGKRFQVLSCPERLIFDLPAQGSAS